MGARTSHMNIYNISHVTQLSVANCANILTFIEDPALDPQTLIFGVKTYKKAEPIKRADSENSIDNHSEKSDIIPVPIIIVDIPPVDENKLFMLTVPECHRILDIFQVLPSDKDTIIQLFRLLDKNGSKVVVYFDAASCVIYLIATCFKYYDYRLTIQCIPLTNKKTLCHPKLFRTNRISSSC